METLDYGPTGRKSGMILCTAGHRDVLLNGQPLRVQEGMVCLFTPLVALFELSRDDDYADIVIADDTTVFYSTVRTVIDIIANQRIFKRPYLVCTRAYIDYFKRQHTAIEAKRASLREARSKEEERLLTQTLHLLEQEAMLEFVYQYCTNNGTDGQELEKGDSIIFGFFSTLYQECKTRRDVAYYAAKANLSSRHFARIIRNKTGKAPSEWIAYLTVVNAQTLLKQTEKSIKEIAAELHFPEQFTFRKFFKLHTGMSPKKYRTRQKADAG